MSQTHVRMSGIKGRVFMIKCGLVDAWSGGPYSITYYVVVGNTC